MKIFECKGDTLLAGADERRLELVDFRLGLVAKIPTKNRMRRTWLKAGSTAEGHPLAHLTARMEGDFLRVQMEVKPGASTWFFEGLHLRFKYTGQADCKNRQSYFAHNSFAFNGIRPELKRKVGLKDGAPRPSRANQLLFRERRGVAWWMTALKSTTSARSLFLGVESAKVLPTTFTIHKSKGVHWIDIYQGLQGEYLHLNRRIESDAILIHIGDTIAKTMEEYGRLTGEKNGARPQPGRRGWSSWYKYYPRISERTIVSETDRVKSKLPGFELLQIDDGYQPKVGDWTNRPDTFPSGMPALSKRIREKGLKPGIWLAPFMVDKKSQLALSQAKRDWFLHSFKGKLLTYKIPRHSTNYILDITHPEVQDFVRENIQRYREWGFEYLKIDFLMLQASQARRHDPSVTGMEAYRKALKLVREAAGAECDILLSGSIAPAGIGTADANRTGPDIAYDILGGNTRLAFIKAQLMATAAHAFTGRKWFTPNPDAAVIRPPLKESLVEMMLAQVAMTGGDFILSDALEDLSDERLQKALHPLLQEMTSKGGTLTPLDYFDNVSPLKVAPNPLMIAALYNPPRFWLWRSGTQRVLIVFNFSFSKSQMSFDLSARIREYFGESLIQDVPAKDIFHSEEMKIDQGRFAHSLPAESVRIFPLED